MTTATFKSATVHGVTAYDAKIEVDVRPGMSTFGIVGHPDSNCRERRDRVRAAIMSAGFDWPQMRITVNTVTGPGDKTSGSFDLPIALAILTASGQIDLELDQAFGELGLDGSVRPSAGDELLARHLGPLTYGPLFDNWFKDDTSKWCVSLHLGELHSRDMPSVETVISSTGINVISIHEPDQRDATEALAQTTAEGRNLSDRARDAHNAVGIPAPDNAAFRYPHPGASVPAIVGGGSRKIRPGEASLTADGGVLLLDLDQTPTSTIDALGPARRLNELRVARGENQAILPPPGQIIGMVTANSRTNIGENHRALAPCIVTDRIVAGTWTYQPLESLDLVKAIAVLSHRRSSDSEVVLLAEWLTAPRIELKDIPLVDGSKRPESRP